MPHTSNKKRHYTPRNHSTPLNTQYEMGHFDSHPNSRYEAGSHGPPFRNWQTRQGRPFGNFNSQPLRHFDAPPPLMPYEAHGPEPFYPPMPFMTDRGFSGQFRRSGEHGYSEYPNRLFIDEYRFATSHQTYQPPRFEAGVYLESDLRWKEENAYELEGKPLLQCNKLRGDAPEFVPGQKSSVEEVPKEKTMGPLVVSSH
ncbi:hypothetical protein BJX99DRAFT_253109 [Aspergillus californicus]